MGASLVASDEEGVREVEMIPRPSRSVRFNVAISCLRARFSDCVDPSSERIASSNLSRSAISPSSVEIYSTSKMNKYMRSSKRKKKEKKITFPAHSEIPGTDLIPELSLFLTCHLRKDFW